MTKIWIVRHFQGDHLKLIAYKTTVRTIEINATHLKTIVQPPDTKNHINQCERTPQPNAGAPTSRGGGGREKGGEVIKI